jgi:outer membrane protein assembly factor BamB
MTLTTHRYGSYVFFSFIICVLCFSGCAGTKQQQGVLSAEQKKLEMNGADGWSQFRGPNRSGVSGEKSTIKVWSGEDPKLVWKREIGPAFSGIAVYGRELITAFGEDSSEYVASFNSDTGEEYWRCAIDTMFTDDLGNGGPRSTPTVDGKQAFALSSNGNFVALDCENGKKIWEVDLASRYSIRVPRRGFTTSPVVLDELVIVHAGGGDGKAIVALNKDSGEVVWEVGDAGVSNSSPVVTTIADIRQIVFTVTRVVEKDGQRQGVNSTISVSPEGELLWKGPSLPGVIAMPVFIAPDKVFVSGSIDDGCVVFQIVPGGDTLAVQEVWKNREMKNHFSSSVLYKGHIYGFSKSTLKCLDAATGERKWRTRGFGKGALIVADDKLLVLSDRGKLALVETSEESFRQLAVAHVLNGKSWTSPTISKGRLYLRNQKEMVCYDLTR